MRLAVVLTPITDEPELSGWYNARLPALDLTTQGLGLEGALAAAKDLAELWVAEKLARGEAIPNDAGSVFAEIEIADALHAA